ncbi:hypothetical protein [Bradyrhizobium sp. BR 1433]|uniref:hypothetical protein n=1 Tax=Bradyrhizobium sp. BR 1433 TaxID=3447967 RepID=UPI003EE55E12
MGNAVSSSISAERTIAGRIEAAGQQATRVTVGRLSLRSRGTDVTTPVCDPDRVSRGMINLGELLSRTPASTMRQPCHHEAPTDATERRRKNDRTPHRQDRQRVAADTIEIRSTPLRDGWHNLHEPPRYVHANNHYERTRLLP